MMDQLHNAGVLTGTMPDTAHKYNYSPLKQYKPNHNFGVE